MTNKTVTISRELAERMRQRLIDLGQIDDFGPELFQVLNCAAPVVERQEPVAWQRKSKMEDGRWFEVNAEDFEQAVKLGYECRQLYASPPAPVAVNTRMAAILQSLRTNANPALFAPGQLAEVNACLDKVKELN